MSCVPELEQLTPEDFEKLRIKVRLSVMNSVRHSKRSLLDYCDLFLSQTTTTEGKAFAESMKRRVHNDVSIIASQVFAILEIFERGGMIPAFGRTPEEMGNEDEPNRCADCLGTGLVKSQSGTGLKSCKKCRGLGHQIAARA